MLAFVKRHRQRIARLALVGLLLAALLHVLPDVPRDVDLEYHLGPEHAAIVELRVSYLQAGETWHAVRFAFPGGAPSRVRHTLSLPAGDFQLDCELRDKAGRSWRLVRKLRAPASDPVTIRLGA